MQKYQKNIENKMYRAKQLIKSRAINAVMNQTINVIKHMKDSGTDKKLYW